MISLLKICEDNFRELWPQIRPMLVSCCERSNGRNDAETSLEALFAGLSHWWVGIDEERKVHVFTTTEILIYPTGKKVGNIVMTTGTDRKDWLHLMDGIERWAVENGCNTLQGLMRKGWARELTDFKLTHVLLEKEL